MNIRRTVALAFATFMVPVGLVAQNGQTSIASNFNGTAIAAGSDIWFNAVFKLNNPSTATTIQFVNSSIVFKSGTTTYNVAVPNAIITFSAATTQATTVFNTTLNSWVTTVPLQSSLSGNVFLAGVDLHLPSGLPGGINPVTWSGDFLSNTSGLSVNWQWAAAVYNPFGASYASLGVKPVDANNWSIYLNSDHAGTPENYKTDVLGGARGGGGSNYTGSYSGTATVQVGVTPEPATLVLLGTGLSLIGLAAVRSRG